LQAKGILFERNGGEVLEAYTNIDYAMSLLWIDRKSNTGYCTFSEFLWLRVAQQ
jgi:hypothetical protein